MSKKLVKIVFQDEAPEDKQLSITIDGINNEENKISALEVTMTPGDADAFEYNPLVANMYFDILNLIMVIKMEYDKGKKYEGLHTLTREEYKQYVTKVLGYEIPEDTNVSN